MKKHLLIGSTLVIGLSWVHGCGDPNPRHIIVITPDGGTGSGGDTTTGSGGSQTSGSGGDTTGGGSGGISAGSGGAGTGSGGNTTTGSGGSPTSGSGGNTMAGGSGGSQTSGSGGGGGATASGGATGSGGAGPGSGGASASPDVIDDLDDDDDQILMQSGRRGPWHAFNDSNGGNQVPSVNGPFAPGIVAGGASGSPYAVHTTGSGYASFGGVGFDLANPTDTPGSMQCQAYDASAFSGITFWAKGNGNLRVEFPTQGFVPTANGGTCSSGTCWNVYGSRDVQGKLTNDWQQFTINFSSNQREDGTNTPAFDPSKLMGIAFKHEGATFDFWIDQIAFVRK